MGDWNVAPHRRRRVGRRRVLRGQVAHLARPERAGFGAVVDAGYADVVRPFHPGRASTPTGTTSGCAFARREGMRIDFVLASPALAARVTDAAIDREERKGKGASDHAPVLVQLG